MDPHPFFVVGMGRSGTTLLRLMLHHHPRIAVPYESSFLTSYQEQADRFGDLQDDVRLRRLVDSILAEPNLRRWDHTFVPSDVIGRVTARSVAGVVDAVYSDYAAGKGKARWGDKSDYLDRLHLVHQMFPDARFIHIIRDGRDVAQSVLRLPWGPGDIVQAAEWWNEHLWVARRIGVVLGPSRYMEVRYEHLVQEPARELQRCCAFLGEDYSDQMLSYHRDSDAAIPEDRRVQHRGYDRPPDASRVHAWKREMSRSDVALFSRHARRMLLELDYEVPGGGIDPVRLGLAYGSVLAGRVWRRGTSRQSEPVPVAARAGGPSPARSTEAVAGTF